ncbi:MAG: hypothetical protein GX339_05235 [Tissierellia bacterium]|nr:hypothetical protein [Tissierellia bacterium]
MKTNKERKKDFYIYNHFQAQFFLDQGLCPIRIGKGSRGDLFIRFERNEEAERVFEMWCDRWKK